ncbi:hypothetical protein KCU88_g6800, partial [Aureobasidium melanogenum]
MTYTLVLLRHGQSTWNELNLFTGWVDVPLSEKGVAEAKQAGTLLKKHSLLPDIVYTSWLRRSINTANLCLDEADRLWIPVKRAWELNERHYGGLQGKNKAEAAEKFGEKQVKLWRRSYDTRPPEFGNGTDAKSQQDPDGRYAKSGVQVPSTECLKDVLERAWPYWLSDIVPDLQAGKTVLVAAHGNSLRAIIKGLEGISDEEIPGLELPTGVPILYELDENLKVVSNGGKGKLLE